MHPQIQRGGDQYVTLNSDALYTYTNSFLKSAGVDFKFDFNLLDEASRTAVINDINNSIYKNMGVVSPTQISSYTAGAGDFQSSGISANLSFLTQRDELKRAFSGNNETFANGTLSKSGDNYVLTLAGTSGGNYLMNSTVNCSTLESSISTAIINQMKYLYNLLGTQGYPYSDARDLSVITNPDTGLGLGGKYLTFQNGSDAVSLGLDLSLIEYGNIITEADYDTNGTTPFSPDFATKVNNYVTANMDSFLQSSLSVGGNGASYQNLQLFENTVTENVAVNTQVVDGFTMTLQIQSGAMKDTNIDISYDYLRLGTLGIKSANVRTPNAAGATIKSVDKAIQKVSQQRAIFGAYTNRLEHAYAINDISSENMQTAESKIRDTDMAKEMVNYMKHQILEQAGQTLLTQANQNSKMVLNLLS